jgi:hypothetical protein
MATLGAVVIGTNPLMPLGPTSPVGSLLTGALRDDGPKTRGSHQS